MATNKTKTPETETPDITPNVTPDETPDVTPDVTPNVNPAMNAPVTEAQIRAETAAAAKSIRQEERVEIYIERAQGNDEPNLFVSVNGYNCLLPKGKTSLVPKSVAAEINRARRAQQRLDATIDALKEAANQKAE